MHETTVLVWKALDESISARGIAPTYAEIARAVDCSVNTVHYHVAKLKKAGVVRVSPRLARSLVLIKRFDQRDESG